MTFRECKLRSLTEAGYDENDLEALNLRVSAHLNRAYDELLWHLLSRDTGYDEEDVLPLRADGAEPLLPEWAQYAMCDYAARCLLLEGGEETKARALNERYQRAFVRIYGMSDTELADLNAKYEGRRRSRARFRNIPV